MIFLYLQAKLQLAYSRLKSSVALRKQLRIFGQLFNLKKACFFAFGILRCCKSMKSADRAIGIKKCFKHTEALLRTVAPGARFRGGTLFRTKNRWRPNKKKRSPLQNKWVFGPKVCEEQKKKKSLHLKISGFLV